MCVFTDDGIWFLQTNSEGDFTGSKPGSRDVCVSEKSITSIDNAVVFVTDKAVMLISGSEVISLSENMNGKHFHLDGGSSPSTEYSLISSGAWAPLLESVTDDTHFMAFMKEAFIVYDYPGNRLVFFKPDEVYQYVYCIETKTWHKMFVERDEMIDETTYAMLPVRFNNPISDYPDTYVNATFGGQNPSKEILKISTRKDVTSSGLTKGMIITRTIDLDAAYVRKSIRDIRIRGVFDKSHVRYILLGSYDGLSWSVLGSLRGSSHKFFRMIVLTNLGVNERISYIDIDFEERYNNKLR